MRLPLLPRVLMLSGAGLLIVVLLATGAPPAAAGDIWQTATDASSGVVNSNLVLGFGQEEWFVVYPALGDVLHIDISTDGPIRLGLFWADGSGQPNRTFYEFDMGPAGLSNWIYDVPLPNTTTRFLLVRGNDSANDTHVALTVGAVPVARLSPGQSVTFRMLDTAPRSTGREQLFFLNNSLLGGTDGLWTINISVDFDNSSTTPAEIAMQALCVGIPYCAPEGLPAGYVRGAWRLPDEPIDLLWRGGATLSGAGSRGSLLYADPSHGLVYLRFFAGYFSSTPPANATVDITCTVNVTRSPLPASNSDDYPAGANAVSTHAKRNGTFRIDSNTVDWYKFQAPPTSIDISLDFAGTKFTDGTNRTGHLRVEVETILFDESGKPVAAANNEFDFTDFNCIGCFAGLDSMSMSTPTGLAPGSTVYLLVHVFSTLGADSSPTVSYDLVVDLPNHLPTATRGALNLSMDEDTSAVQDVAPWFFDEDGDSLVFAAVVVSSSVALSPSFSLSNLNLAPARDASGFASIRVTARDGYGSQVAEVWVNLTVLPVNDAPRGDGTTRYVIWNQGTNSSPFEVGPAFQDVDGDALVFALTVPTGFSATTCGASCFVVHPAHDDIFGNFSAVVRATDPSGLHASVPVRLVVIHVNRPPALSDVLPPSPITASHTAVVTLTATATDPDGDTLSFAWVVDGLNQAETGPQLEVFGLSPGNHSARLTVWDGNETVRAFWNLVITNSPPAVEAVPSGLAVQVSHNASSEYTVDATDPDGDPLTYAWWVDGLPVSGTGPTLTVGPLRIGAHDVRVEASDGSGTAGLTWSVQSTDSPPVLHPTPASPSIVQSHRDVLLFGGGALDPDRDPMAFVWLVDGKVMPGAEGPTHSLHALTTGDHTVTVRVTANRLEAEFTWSLTLTNEAPVLGLLNPSPGAANMTAGERLDLHALATDADGDPLTYAWIVDGKPTGQSGQDYSLGPLTPVGEHTVRFVATDSEGASASAEWTVTVEQPVAPPPPDEPPSTAGPGTALAVLALAAACVVAGWRRRRP